MSIAILILSIAILPLNIEIINGYYNKNTFKEQIKWHTLRNR